MVNITPMQDTITCFTNHHIAFIMLNWYVAKRHTKTSIQRHNLSLWRVSEANTKLKPLRSIMMNKKIIIFSKGINMCKDKSEEINNTNHTTDNTDTRVYM
jgi:hypothetical protein